MDPYHASPQESATSMFSSSHSSVDTMHLLADVPDVLDAPFAVRDIHLPYDFHRHPIDVVRLLIGDTQHAATIPLVDACRHHLARTYKFMRWKPPFTAVLPHLLLPRACAFNQAESWCSRDGILVSQLFRHVCPFVCVSVA